jgi:hypothetical protein
MLDKGDDIQFKKSNIDKNKCNTKQMNWNTYLQLILQTIKILNFEEQIHIMILVMVS